MMETLRKDLSMPGLLETVRKNFQRITDKKNFTNDVTRIKNFAG